MLFETELNSNERRVLDVIWRLGPIPRSGIAPLTGLSTMSVTRITQVLGARGLLSEEIIRTGQRGQPARPLRIQRDAAYAAGVYFSTAGLQVGLMDLSGTLLGTRLIAADATSVRRVVSSTQSALRSLLMDLQVAEKKLVGVGFALPGDFLEGGRKLNAHAFFPEFHEVDLQDEFQQHLPWTALVENDAASVAIGERMLGAGQCIGSFFLTHIGHGIGGGLILDGRLVRGTHGNAGIIGSQFPLDQPRPSGQDLLLHLNAHGVEVSDFLDLENLSPQDCPALEAWLDRAAGQLRDALRFVARLLDPEAIIIGGRLPSHILRDITARIDDGTFCAQDGALPSPRLEPSQLGPIAGVIGAAALPLYDRFFV